MQKSNLFELVLLISKQMILPHIC